MACVLKEGVCHWAKGGLGVFFLSAFSNYNYMYAVALPCSPCLSVSVAVILGDGGRGRGRCSPVVAVGWWRWDGGAGGRPCLAGDACGSLLSS